MTDILIDNDSLIRTARALEVINPGRSSAEHIRNMICAHLGAGESSYISTCGWIAFTWIDDKSRTNVRVAVEPYSVLRHLGLEVAA